MCIRDRIWNQICDALIYSTRRQANEVTYDVSPYTAEADENDLALGIAIEQALDKAKLEAPPSTVKGIEAIKLMADGYTCREKMCIRDSLKHKDNGDTQIETEEIGAEFEVYLKSAGSYENAKETERGYLVTDEWGYAEIDYLPYGIYTVKQVKGSEGVELMKPFDVFISEPWSWQQFIINNAPVSYTHRCV